MACFSLTDKKQNLPLTFPPASRSRPNAESTFMTKTIAIIRDLYGISASSRYCEYEFFKICRQRVKLQVQNRWDTIEGTTLTIEDVISGGLIDYSSRISLRHIMPAFTWILIMTDVLGGGMAFTPPRVKTLRKMRKEISEREEQRRGPASYDPSKEDWFSDSEGYDSEDQVVPPRSSPVA